MKREYQKPFAEKIEFDYRNQIVATSGMGSGSDCQPAECHWSRPLGTGACSVSWISPSSPF